MAHRDPLFEFMPYGAPELRAVARTYQLRALLLASALAAICFVLAGVLGAVTGRASQPPHAVDLSIHVIAEPPPRLDVAPPPPEVKPTASAPAKVGVPTPVPDIEAPPEDAPPAPPSDATAGPGDPNGPSTSIVADDPGLIVSAEPPGWREFQPVDVLPQVVHEVKPPYPDFPREAGVEGRVLVHVLVGLDGHVLRAEADPHATVPMLEAAAVDAALAWVFTPALANGHPVKAWATIPFNFTLH